MVLFVANVDGCVDAIERPPSDDVAAAAAGVVAADVVACADRITVG